jgi:hypothetical protein
MSDRASQVDQIIDAAASIAPGACPIDDRRQNRRLPYNAPVAMQFLARDGAKQPPITGRGRDLSASGIKIDCDSSVPAKSTGVIQLVRSNGQIALIGVKVMYCRPDDASRSHTLGLQFAPLPESIAIADYCDQQGKLKLLDPSLRPPRAA